MKNGVIKEVFEMIEKHKVRMVDLKFTDFLGQWHHFSVPVHELTEKSFEVGFPFDGSSIRGWKSIDESDMFVVPDPTTAFIDPFIEVPTISMICNVYDPITKEKYERCPRYIAQKAEAYLKSTGIADVAYFGPEAEFFIFDDVRFDQNTHQGYYYIDSAEGQWNTGRDDKPNLAYKVRYKEGYFPVPPIDSLNDIRNEMVMIMEQCGFIVETQHHEVATAGQGEIDFRFAPLVKCGDNVMLFKYIVKNVARRRGKVATFMPKPIFGDNGSGMHCHQSLWKDGQPLFYGDGYANLSKMALYYIGGILKHAPALCAFTNPTTNSYKRLVPGFEAPVNLVYSYRNRSAAIRIPATLSPAAKRIEVRFPDGSCNPYLAFAAMLMAGLDGIMRKIDPGEPLDRDIYSLSPSELEGIRSTPGSLDDALRALEQDHNFLLMGDVFTIDVIETWIKYKWEKEVNQLRMRPHPYEFLLYFDV